MIECGPEVFDKTDVDQIDQRLFPTETLVWFDVPECPSEFQRTLRVNVRVRFVICRFLSMIGYRS